MAGVMGFGSPPPAQQPSIYDRLVGGLLGQPSSYGGMLTPEEQKAAQQRGLLALGTQLMAAGGPSDQRTSFGQALAPALMAGQQAQQQYGQDMLQAMLLKTKLQKTDKGGKLQQDYEYAKSQGFKGSIEDWKRVASAQPQSPAGIQEYEYFQKLTPEQQKQFMSLQRSPVVPKVVMVNGVPTLVDPTSTTAPNPLSTQASEIEAATAKAGAEAEAKALGSAKGEAQGGLAKKGINAMNVLETLELADPLVDVATGSGTGAAADKVAAFFGESTTGDQAIAQLKIIQANLMANMPRMEGPQSDRDVQLYREAAGELGDPAVPRQRKKAAVNMIRALQQKYAEGTAPSSAKPAKRVRVDAQGNVIGN
jgi:hypothetical protein